MCMSTRTCAALARLTYASARARSAGVGIASQRMEYRGGLGGGVEHRRALVGDRHPHVRSGLRRAGEGDEQREDPEGDMGLQSLHRGPNTSRCSKLRRGILTSMRAMVLEAPGRPLVAVDRVEP